MITLKEAITSAQRYMDEIYDQSVTSALVEEAELDEVGHQWYITISFLLSSSLPPPSTIEALLSRKTDERQYKAFTIDAETGRVKSMKIRQLAI